MYPPIQMIKASFIWVEAVYWFCIPAVWRTCNKFYPVVKCSFMYSSPTASSAPISAPFRVAIVANFTALPYRDIAWCTSHLMLSSILCLLHAKGFSFWPAVRRFWRGNSVKPSSVQESTFSDCVLEKNKSSPQLASYFWLLSDRRLYHIP